MARGQTDDAPLYYWFDSEHETLYSDSTGSGQWKQTVDVSQLKVGLHTFYVITTDSKGRVSTPEMRQFYKIDQSAGGEQYRCLCYVDGEMFCQKEVSANGGMIDMELDATGLSEGMHRIQLQVLTASGVVSGIHNGFFLRTATTQELGRLRCMCYVDGMLFSEESVSAEGGALSMNLDASGLTEGLHSIQMQVITETGVVSGVYNGFFIRKSMEQEIGQFRCLCYVDGELFSQEKMSADGGLLSLDLDTTPLTEGLHRIQLQVMTKSGIISGAYNGFFLRTATSEELGQFMCMCYIDGEMYSQEKMSAEGGLLHLDLNASSLSEGMHRIQLQVMTENGTVSGTYNGFFLRIPTQEEQSNYSCIYAVDDETESHKLNLVGNDGVYHFDLDMSRLSDGLHHISYFLSSDKGVSSSPQTRFFIKSPTGGNAIANYQYWLNDDTEHMNTVTLPEAQNPFKLISILPVEKVPVRSSQFHFEIKDGEPMMYAKNDFHVRFYDSSARFTDETKSYVDYNVSKAVTEVEWLESGVRATAERPEENAVKWYCLEAEFGDSLIFKANQACTMQLFSPTGSELFSVSGNKTVKDNGCHVFADGTYYLAVHDVTGTSNQYVTIDYQKIDRYAVLAYTPKTIGAPSLANISIEGNGFTDSTEVSLAMNDVVIKAANIHAADLGHITASFMMEDMPFGAYDLRVKYTEEDSICISKAIKVEKADSITDVTIALLGNGSVMRGRVANYELRFTNHSNLPVLSLPFTLTIDCGNSIENLTGLKFETDLKQQARASLRKAYADVCTPAELEELEKAVLGDDDLYMFYADTLSTPGKAYLVGNFVLPRLDGNSTLTVPFSIWCDDISSIILYASTIPHWNIYEYVIGDPDDDEPEDPDNPNHGGSEGGNGGSGGSGDSEQPGSSGSGGGSGTSGGGSGTSGGGSDSSGGGHGGGSGGTVTLNCKDVCGPKLAYNCLSSIVESVDVFGSVGEAVRECAGGYVQEKGTDMIFDALCEGKLPDFSQIRRNPVPVLTDITKDIAISGLKCVGIDVVKRIVGGRVYKFFNVANNCVYQPLKAWVEACSYTSSTLPVEVVNSCEPNEIYGYTAESGSKAIMDGVKDVYYTIQFENDTVFATAPAHDIYLTDTLDVKLFDLSTYKPTRIKIGDKSAELTGERNFVTTVDMRPDIHAIAQVEGTIDDKTGIVRWHISSLDPMTMEPIEDAEVGVLPVNFDGSGIGEASFDISLKPDLPHGTEIPNRSGNVFDLNETVMTPTWTNVIDCMAPESHVTNVEMATDSTAVVKIAATDELSGPWRYDVYVQYGSGSAWFKAAENVPIDTTATVKVYEGINHGFYVVVTDSAGNVEQKNVEREFTLEVFGSQVDTNTRIDLAEGWNWMSHNQQEALALDALKPKAQRMVGQTEELFKDARFGWMGDLEELLPTQMYKVQMAEAMQVQLGGRLFNAGFRSVPLCQGWNWLGYPVANAMTPAEALAKLEAEEDDMIIGQDGMATFADGAWTGTLTELTPGQGYMYRSVSDKNLFYNATAQASARQMAPRRAAADTWSVDKRKYPNVMGLVATLSQNGSEAVADEWIVAAFCGDECRGVAQAVNGVLMMNVYGTGSELISFYAMSRDTEEVMQAQETEDFRADVLGTMAQPYQLNIGQATGITAVGTAPVAQDGVVYDLQGRRIGETLSAINAQLKKGVYIVTDGSKRGTNKVVRK